MSDNDTKPRRIGVHEGKIVTPEGVVIGPDGRHTFPPGVSAEEFKENQARAWGWRKEAGGRTGERSD